MDDQNLGNDGSESADERLENLFARVVNGDTSATDAFAVAFRESLLGYLQFIDRNLAEDTLHDVLIALLQNPSKHRHVDSCKSYFGQACRRALLSKVAKRSRIGLEPYGSRDHPGPDDSQALASEKAILSEKRELVRAAIEKLPKVYREVIFLNYYEEMPLEKIAKLKGVPSGTIRSRHFRAKEQLRQALSRFQ
jgi:RNA polymerase sigma factor (sigma-70 family)